MHGVVYLSAFTVLIFTLSTFTIQDAHATGGTLAGGPSCDAIGGAWNNVDTCFVSSLTIDSGEILVINTGIILRNSGTISNFGTISNSGTMTNDNTIVNSGTITNTGTINNHSGTSSTNGGYFRNDGIINNDNFGTINNNSGGIGTSSGIFSNNGNIFNNSGGTINNNYGGTIFNNSGGTITNGSIINNYSVAFTNNSGGTIDNSGTINNIGFGTITNSGTITNNSAIANTGTITNFGTITNTGTISLSTFAIIGNFGTIDNTGTIANSGAIGNQGGIITNTGTINNNSGGNINNNSGGTITNDGTITNSGFIGNNTGTINNNVNGIINNNSGIITNNGGIINNTGTINNNASAINNNTSTINNFGVINNPGTINNRCSAVYSGNQPTGNQVNFIACPDISINDVTLVEGNSKTTSFDFTVTRSGDTTGTSTVNFATADSTATLADSDYDINSGLLTFTAGQTTKTASVLVNGDMVVEPDEQFFVDLSNCVGCNITDLQGIGTITNDDSTSLPADPCDGIDNNGNGIVDEGTVGVDDNGNGIVDETGEACPSASISDISIKEGNLGTTQDSLTVTLSEPAPIPISIDYETMPGTATEIVDYAKSSGQLIFDTGETSKTILVTVNGDILDEQDEIFAVNLLNPVNAVINDGQGIVTIIDDDPMPIMSINDVTVTEGNDGTISAVFTVVLSNPSAQIIIANFATADGTASSLDYVANSGTIIFSPGDTTKLISIDINGDTLNEPNETFFVNLLTPTNAVIGDGQGIGTIVDNDPVHLVTLDVAKDSFLRQNSPNTNEGANVLLGVTGTNANLKRTLLSFDLSPYAGNHVQTAKIRLFIDVQSNNWGKNGQTIEAHKLNTSWVEGNGYNLNAFGGSRGTGAGVTWNCAIDGNITNKIPNCNRPGWNGGIFNSTPSAVVTIKNGMLLQWVEFDVTSDVNSMLTGSSNNGWIIKKTDETSPGTIAFLSKESDPTTRPQLVLTIGS